MKQQWIDNEHRSLTQEHGEVLAFHPEWIDDDFNPKGTRVGFLNGDYLFYSAKWNNRTDSYETCVMYLPTHYMPLPKMPSEFDIDPRQLGLFA